MSQQRRVPSGRALSPPGANNKELHRSHLATIRSDSQTTGLTLTTGVWESCRERRGASNMNIHYDVTGLLSEVCKVTLSSTCVACLSWPGRRGGGGGSYTHSTYA